MQDNPTHQKKPKQGLALVTGASSGIGEAYAHQLAQEGYDLILIARREDRLKTLSSLLHEKHGVEAYIISVDLSQTIGVSQLLSHLASHSFQVDYLVNNAGFGTNGTFLDTPIERELEMIDLNCKALVRISHFIANDMKKRGVGVIVHTASVGGLLPTPYYAVYGATKAFVVSFSESLAEELKSFGIRVQTLCPGPTDTEFMQVSNFQGKLPPPRFIQSSMAVVEKSYRDIQTRRRSCLLIPHSVLRWVDRAMGVFPRKWVRALSARSMKPTNDLLVKQR